MLQRFVALFAIVLSCATASLAASDPPSPDQPTPVPTPSPAPIVLPTMPPARPVNPYVKMGIDALTGLVRRQLANQPNAVNGGVTFFKRFELQVQYAPNAYREVHLHQGTVINPRGATLAPGQRVAVSGQNQPDGSLDANVITIQQ